MSATSLCLQSLFLPELLGLDARKMYFSGDFQVIAGNLVSTLKVSSEISTNTYFNGFFLDQWTKLTDVSNVRFKLAVNEGSGTLALCHQTVDGTRVKHKMSIDAEMSDVYEVVIDIRPLGSGILYWTLIADKPLVVADAGYFCDRPPVRTVTVGIVITAFKRDEAIQDAISRFHQSELPAEGHRLLIVDNGGTLEENEHVLANENLGGAGGFTRGLLELRDDPAITHALFMDDDAPVHMGCISRAIAFLRYSRDDRSAIAGAMLSEEEPSVQYGAGLQLNISTPTFLKSNRDMAETSNLLQNEQGEPAEIGGWYFFMFPLQFVDHLPFPFFVRGDDVLFSLQNKFEIVTLTGIACWQTSFEEKISPSTTYLAYRARFLNGCLTCHKSQHDIFDVFSEIEVAVNHNLQSFRYAYAHAILDAVEDVLDGPHYFEENPSALKRLSEIGVKYREAYPRQVSASRVSRYRPLSPWIKLSSPASRLLAKLTRNGHQFIFPWKRPALVYGLAPCANMQLIGHREALFRSKHSDLGIPVRRSRKECLAVSRRLSNIKQELFEKGPQWLSAFKLRLPFLQSEQFWRQALRMEARA